MPTKEQVLKRMVEIEFPGKMKGPGSWVCDSKDAEGVMQGLFTWNPLDTPSDWAVLIEKYQMHISCDDEGVWDANVPRRYGGYPGATNESLPWAICLAIIESKGGMGDE